MVTPDSRFLATRTMSSQNLKAYGFGTMTSFKGTFPGNPTQMTLTGAAGPTTTAIL